MLIALSSDTIIKQANIVFKTFNSSISKTKFIIPMATGPILDFPISANISFCMMLRYSALKVQSLFLFSFFPSLYLTHIQSITNFCCFFLGGGVISYTCLSVPSPLFHHSLTFIALPLTDNNNLPTVFPYCGASSSVSIFHVITILLTRWSWKPLTTQHIILYYIKSLYYKHHLLLYPNQNPLL